MQNNIDESILTDEKTFSTDEAIDEGCVQPIHLLTFAKRILFYLLILFILAGMTELWSPGNAIFEACKMAIPSLATLVIGYYFGASK